VPLLQTALHTLSLRLIANRAGIEGHRDTQVLVEKSAYVKGELGQGNWHIRLVISAKVPWLIGHTLTHLLVWGSLKVL